MLKHYINVKFDILARSVAYLSVKRLTNTVAELSLQLNLSGNS